MSTVKHYRNYNNIFDKLHRNIIMKMKEVNLCQKNVLTVAELAKHVAQSVEDTK